MRTSGSNKLESNPANSQNAVLSGVKNSLIIWHTVESMDGLRDLKQHAYMPYERGRPWEDKYEGNKSLCGKIGIHDGDKFINLNGEESEEINNRCCKHCLKIYEKHYL